jgi:murein DD-endopeptidase MepM/ murein hydrolase activator NlpD
MRFMNLLRNKTLLCRILICSLAFCLPWMFFFSTWMKGGVSKTFQEKARNGVGGGTDPERLVFVDAEPDSGFSGIPEPKEFSKPNMLSFTSYVLEKGDIIGNIAIQAGLNTDTLISVNDIKNARTMQIGQVIRIPNQDGIYYAVKIGDTLESLAEKYNTTAVHISTANGLFSDTLMPNERVFIPGAKLDWVNRQEINGDLFIWPCTGYISSLYGYRIAPFAGTRQFHSGLDIASSMGSPVKAAMAGRVSQVGFDYSFGNFVLISHHSGYRTFYGHMNDVRVKTGAYVETGERIGDIGSTGLSTGPHLHFSVYKNGVTVNPRSLMR